MGLTMMKIQWMKLKAKPEIHAMKVADYLSLRVDKAVTLGEAFNGVASLLEHWPKKFRGQVIQHQRTAISIFGPDTDISKITFRDLLENKKLNELGESAARKAQTEISRAIFFAFSGQNPFLVSDPTPKKEPEPEKEDFEIKMASDADLTLLVTPVGSRDGKYAGFQSKLIRFIQDCPPNEIRVIEPPKDFVANKKMRGNLMININIVLNKLSPPWVFRWSKLQKTFYACTVEKWEKVSGRKFGSRHNKKGGA